MRIGEIKRASGWVSKKMARTMLKNLLLVCSMKFNQVLDTLRTWRQVAGLLQVHGIMAPSIIRHWAYKVAKWQRGRGWTPPAGTSSCSGKFHNIIPRNQKEILHKFGGLMGLRGLCIFAPCRPKFHCILGVVSTRFLRWNSAFWSQDCRQMNRNASKLGLCNRSQPIGPPVNTKW